MEYTVKKSFWGKSIVDRSGEKYKLKNSAFKIKIDKDNTFKFYHNGIAVTSSIVEFSLANRENIVYAKTTDGAHLYIDTELGNVSPEFVHRDNNIIIDKDHNIVFMDDRYNATPTGYKTATNNNPSHLEDIYNNVYAVNNEGKYGAICTETGKVKCPFIFDKPIERYNIETMYNNGGPVYTFSNDTTFALVNVNGEVILSGDIKDMPTKVSRKNYFVCTNKENNTSVLYDFDVKTKSLVSLGTHKGDVRSFERIENKYYIISYDENKKANLCNEKGEHYLDAGKYDKIYFKEVTGDRRSSKRNVEIIVLEKDGLIGFYIPETNQLIEPQFKEFDHEFSGRAADGSYRFFAENKDYLWGVVDGNNNELLPFNYKHSTSYRSCYGSKSGNYLLEVKEKEGETKLLGVFEEQMINEKPKPDYSHSKEEKTKSSKTPEKQPRYTEDERYAAAIGASILMGSPIAGLIVNELMKD